MLGWARQFNAAGCRRPAECPDLKCYYSWPVLHRALEGGIQPLLSKSFRGGNGLGGTLRDKNCKKALGVIT